jgi:hypothetical protein
MERFELTTGIYFYDSPAEIYFGPIDPNCRRLGVPYRLGYPYHTLSGIFESNSLSTRDFRAREPNRIAVPKLALIHNVITVRIVFEPNRTGLTTGMLISVRFTLAIIQVERRQAASRTKSPYIARTINRTVPCRGHLRMVRAR